MSNTYEELLFLEVLLGARAALFDRIDELFENDRTEDEQHDLQRPDVLQR